MKPRSYGILSLAMSCCLAAFLSSACTSRGKADQTAEGPLPTQVEHAQDANLFKVDHPEQFPSVTAGEREGFRVPNKIDNDNR